MSVHYPNVSADQYQLLLNDELLPNIKREQGIILTHREHRPVTPVQLQMLSDRFDEGIFPLLTPLAYSPESDDTDAIATCDAMRIISCALQELVEQ